MGSLDGITVISLEQAVAAPFATRQLADLGARVIKVERPGVGDIARAYDRSVKGESSYFVWLNRGKQSIELDLKDPQDRLLLDEMIDRADVFVQNLIPGAVTRLGLDDTTLRARRPELIYVSISGYGKDGPFGGKKAYDALVQAETGLISANGTHTSPAKVPISVADISTGMYACMGILTALYGRERSRCGSTIDVTMIDALGEWMLQPAYYSAYGGKEWVRTGARHGTIAPYGPYRCGDGAEIFLAIQSDREWGVFCKEVLGDSALEGDPRFARNPDRLENNDFITSLLESAFRHLTVKEVSEVLDRAGIANARMRSPSSLFQHPQLLERLRWRDIDTPGGVIKALLPAVTLSGQEPAMGAVPALGMHNKQLRDEFGSSSEARQ